MALLHERHTHTHTQSTHPRAPHLPHLFPRPSLLAHPPTPTPTHPHTYLDSEVCIGFILKLSVVSNPKFVLVFVKYEFLSVESVCACMCGLNVCVCVCVCFCVQGSQVTCSVTVCAVFVQCVQCVECATCSVQ